MANRCVPCGLNITRKPMATSLDGMPALSAITEKDCAVYRIVANKEICHEATGDRRPAKVIVSSDTADDFAACFWAISAISRETRLRAPFCRDGKVLLQEPKVAAVRLMVKHTKPEF